VQQIFALLRIVIFWHLLGIDYTVFSVCLSVYLLSLCCIVIDFESRQRTRVAL
jgi:hypothetical protein